MKIKIDKIIEEIELVRDGKVIERWFRIDGDTWDSLTKKVKEDGHWGRFLVFEKEEKENQKGGKK